MSNTQKQKFLDGWTIFIFVAGALIVLGLFMFADAFAVNATMINVIETQLQDESVLTNVFPAFWLVFLLVFLAVFMAVMIIFRENREMVYFAIGAAILSILVTFLFSAPINFDYQENTTLVKVSEINDINGTFYNAEVTHGIKQVVLIPDDKALRLIMVALFTGNTLFCGLYSIFILTNFPFKK